MVIAPFSEIIFSSGLNTLFFFVSAFASLGAGIKYIDAAFDEGTFSKKKAMLLAPFLGVFWAYMMSLNPAAATILAAVVLAVFFTGKIDNRAFWVGIIVIALSLLFFVNLVSFLWFPLIVLVVAGILDEIGNDLAGKRTPVNKFIRFFFGHRFLMKIAVFAFSFFGFFGWVYFAAFLGFDGAYDLVNFYGKRIAINKNKLT